MKFHKIDQISNVFLLFSGLRLGKKTIKIFEIWSISFLKFEKIFPSLRFSIFWKSEKVWKHSKLSGFRENLVFDSQIWEIERAVGRYAV